ncbi:MAG: hypothetical protein ACKO4S_03945 [Snowella sp.]
MSFMNGDRGLVVFEEAIMFLLFVICEGRSCFCCLLFVKGDRCFMVDECDPDCVVCERRSLF